MVNLAKLKYVWFDNTVAKSYILSDKCNTIKSAKYKYGNAQVQ